MRTVAWAEPSSVVTSLTNWDTTQMGADTQHDQPLWSLDTLSIGLGVTEGGDVDLVGLVDFLGRSVTDENWLTTPLDDDLFFSESVLRTVGQKWKQFNSRSFPLG
jgi:hypothetical protein